MRHITTLQVFVPKYDLSLPLFLIKDHKLLHRRRTRRCLRGDHHRLYHYTWTGKIPFKVSFSHGERSHYILDTHGCKNLLKDTVDKSTIRIGHNQHSDETILLSLKKDCSNINVVIAMVF